jgi:Ca2+-binding EF-hand superfamily protein
VTSVSALGSTLTAYKAPLNPLDTNGDGVVSADELAAASQSSTAKSSTDSSASNGDDGSSPTDVVQKITADILALMLSLQKTDGDGKSGTDDNSDDSKGSLSALDANGDGKLTTSELLSADPQKIAAAGGDDEDGGLMAKVLTDMQTSLRAYQTTYGNSPAATGESDQTA